jgi:hypothetical protein
MINVKAAFALELESVRQQRSKLRPAAKPLRWPPTPARKKSPYPVTHETAEANLAALLEELRALRRAAGHQNILLKEQDGG